MNGSISIAGLLLAVIILTGTCFGGMLFASSDSPIVSAMGDVISGAAANAVTTTPSVRVMTLTPDPSQKATVQAASQLTATSASMVKTQVVRVTQTAEAAQATRAAEEAQVATMTARTSTAISLEAGAARVQATKVASDAVATAAADLHRQQQVDGAINSAVIFLSVAAASIAFLVVVTLVLARANEAGIRRNEAASARAVQERQLTAARAQAKETARLRLEAETRMKEARVRHAAVEAHRQEVLRERLQAEAHLHEVEIERLLAEAHLIAVRAEAGLNDQVSQGKQDARKPDGGGNGIRKGKIKDDDSTRKLEKGKSSDRENLPLAE